MASVGKAGALVGVLIVLSWGMGQVERLVDERRQWQRTAEDSVAGAMAGPQTVLGPVAVRECVETWRVQEGEGAKRDWVTKQRSLLLHASPERSQVTVQAEVQARRRGVFAVNSLLADMEVQAQFADLTALQPPAPQAQGSWQCGAAVLAVEVLDARGVRRAAVQVNGESRTVQPGPAPGRSGEGFHVALAQTDAPDAPALAAARQVKVTLRLAGTGGLAWVPTAAQNRVDMRSNWPHPSFGGRFVPVQHEVTPDGFRATWEVSALASTAPRAWRAGGRPCALARPAEGEAVAAVEPGCLDRFGVSLIDPVDRYVLSDRAVKYADLFIVLTFVGVGLAEVLRRLKVHPVQYALVGAALAMFFLLLLSLSEHLRFGLAYALASAACAGLIGLYGAFVLGGWRGGAVLGSGVALLYGALWALLRSEHNALAWGSVLLFAALAAVMFATRRVDWYGLFDSWRPTAVPAPPAQAEAAN